MFKYHFIVHFKRKCVVAMIFFVYLGVIGHYRTLIFTVLTPSTLAFPIYVLTPSVDKISPGML